MKKTISFTLIGVLTLSTLALFSTGCSSSQQAQAQQVTEDTSKIVDRRDLGEGTIMITSCGKSDDTSNSNNSDEETFLVNYKIETTKDVSKEDEFNKIGYVSSIASKETVYTPSSSSSYFGGFAVPDTGEKGVTMSTDMLFNIKKGDTIQYINVVDSNGETIQVTID